MIDLIPLSLRATNEQEMIDALPFTRGVDEDGTAIWITSNHEYELNVIGGLYTDAVVDINGDIVTPSVKLDGYHANIQCSQELADTIPQNVVIHPQKPKVVWF